MSTVLIHPIRDLFDPILVPENSLKNLCNLIHDLPIELTEPWGLEIRLAAGDHQVDISVPVYQSDRLHRDLQKKTTVSGHPSWNLLQNFARLWANPTSIIQQWIRYLYLEFDVLTDGTQIPVPSTFAAIDSPSKRKLSTENLEEKCPEIKAFNEIWTTLMGQTIPHEGQRRIEQCFRYAMPTNRVIGSGVMCSRNTDGNKVRVITLLETEDLADYLINVGYAGALHSLQSILLEVKGLINTRLSNRFPVGFNLNLEGPVAIDQRIGVEIIPAQDENLDGLLYYLMNRGLCSREKLSSILALDHPAVEVSHIKISYCKKSLAEAKIYCNVFPSFAMVARGSLDGRETRGK